MKSKPTWNELVDAIISHAKLVEAISGSNRPLGDYDIERVRMACRSIPKLRSLTPVEAIPFLTSFIADVPAPPSLASDEFTFRSQAYDVWLVRESAVQLLSLASEQIPDLQSSAIIDRDKHAVDLQHLIIQVQALERKVREWDAKSGSQRSSDSELSSSSDVQKSRLIHKIGQGISMGTGGPSVSLEAIGALGELLIVEIRQNTRLTTDILAWYAQQLGQRVAEFVEQLAKATDKTTRTIAGPIIETVKRVIDTISRVVAKVLKQSAEDVDGQGGDTEQPNGQKPPKVEELFPTQKFGPEIVCIDLGTENLRISSTRRGLVYDQPTAVAVESVNGEKYVRRSGQSAYVMLGKQVPNWEIARPMRDGVMADFDLAELLVGSVLKNAFGKSIRSRSAIVTVPASASTLERRGLHHNILSAGFKNVQLIEEGIAAAIGAQLPFEDHEGCMLMVIGAGTTELAVLSLGSTVCSRSLRVAGDRMNSALKFFVEKELDYEISEQVAAAIKLQIGEVASGEANVERKAKTHGRNLKTQRIGEFELTSKSVSIALESCIDAIAEAASRTLEALPVDLATSVSQRGIFLAGAAATLPGLQKRLSAQCRVPVKITPNPHIVTLMGVHSVGMDFNRMRKFLSPEV